MQQTTHHRGGLVAATLIGLMLLIALVIFQSVTAANQRQAPVALKPPFAFQTNEVSASGFKPLPPDATHLLTETFGNGFNPTKGVTGTNTAWRIFTDTGSSELYWNRVIPLMSTTYQDTVWTSCGTCDGNPGTSLDPDTDDYPANQSTWLIYGPIDLRNYYAAEVVFRYWLDANLAVDGSGSSDYLGIGISDDGTNFSGFQLGGDFTATGWQTGTLNLTDHADQSGIYVGFYFHSNGDAQTGKGAFIDNLSLRAAPFINTFLPLFSRNFSVATATPTVTPTPTQGAFVYNYRFNSGQGENDPDFVSWGQSFSSGNPVVYEQGLTGGNPPGQGMYLYNTQLQLVTMAGPNVTAPTNYEINVDFDVNKGKNNSRYGVIFGAGNSTFGRGSGNRPTFNANSNYYKFALQFPDGSGDDPADFQLERCDGNGATCADLVSRRSIPSGAAADGVWDTVTVRRTGNSIVVLINNFQVLSITDATYVGERKFGVFIQSANVNGSANPLEINFDNYRVNQIP